MFRATHVLTALTAVLIALPAFATDGYFSNGYGVQHKGMAGAGVALAFEPMSAATNPAALGFLDSQMEVGVAWFSPDRDYTVTGSPSGYPGTFGLMPGKVVSGSKSFFIPDVGVTWRLRDSLAFGLTLYGNGGMNTDYQAPTFGSSPTGVDLSQAFVGATLAWKPAENQSLGITGLFGYQRFKATGLGAFAPFSSDGADLSDRGYDSSTGYGLRVGWQGRFGRVFKAGLSYQTKMRMGSFKKYAGLFAEQGGFDIPANWTAGIAFQPADTFTLALDVQKVEYSGVKSVGNPFLPNVMTARLGDDGGAGFGWRDMTVTKLGMAWNATPEWTLRAGYSYGRQPIPDSEVLFNILAPGVVEQHATLGTTYSSPAGHTFSLSVMRALGKTVTGPNPLEAPGQQQISLHMTQWEVEAGYGFRF